MGHQKAGGVRGENELDKIITGITITWRRNLNLKCTSLCLSYNLIEYKYKLGIRNHVRNLPSKSINKNFCSL